MVWKVDWFGKRIFVPPLNIVIFAFLTVVVLAFQNCANGDGAAVTSSSNVSGGEGAPASVTCSERKRENLLTVRIPGNFGQGDRFREIVVDNLNFSLFEEIRFHECDHPFERSDVITWTRDDEADETIIDVVLNDELNAVFFNEDGSLKKGETFYYSYQIRVNWYETCDSTEASPVARSASQQLTWELDETITDEDGCEVDIHREFVDFFVPKNAR